LPDPNDAKALAKQITQLLESPALREELSGIALAQAQQMNWAVTTRKYLNLYEALAKSS
jgi:glycosyltransferase involved in cell wall biosynthesis